MDELKKSLHYNDKESLIFMPNEIFKDLIILESKGSSHIAFAYSYYYIISWLFRYAKYGDLSIDSKDIKKILGYNPTYQGVDYITKKNGVLDGIGYTFTSNDYPISWSFEDGVLEFIMLNDLDGETKKMIKKNKSRKYTIKFPNKGLYRTVESEKDNYLDGTFYEIDNTHCVPFEVFLFCMSKKDIRCTGFYLWSYLKMKCQMHVNGYDVSLDDLATETGIERRTLVKYLGSLRGYGMVDCFHNQEYFSLALKDDEKKANTYITNDWELFRDERTEVKKIRVVSAKEHEQIIEHKEGLVGLFE